MAFRTSSVLVFLELSEPSVGFLSCYMLPGAW